VTIGLIIFAFLVWAAPALAGNAWSYIRTPFLDSPQAIGSYNAGCLAGAATLPLKGKGYQVMRPSRNRYYGHPNLIRFVQRLGNQASARGMQLLIGDLSQPRGGPVSTGHRSHQIGLDVDIWFSFGPSNRSLSLEETENRPMVPVVLAAEGKQDPRLWSSVQREALRLAATDPEVERIFVNPIIKKTLCHSERNRVWLHKIRPWWGHDAHFHVRLACPPGNPQCRAQRPIPAGDGCDEELDNWVRKIQIAAKLHPPAEKTEPPEQQTLPEICSAVLRGGMSSRPARSGPANL
jgi:penicillin-insensitive murein endopeptidase